MAKRSGKKRTAREIAPSPVPERTRIAALVSCIWLPLLLALFTFLLYAPSLASDFVYDARQEILDEGFLTSLSNLPAVLSFEVLGSHVMLAGRPGHLLYLMLNAAIWGRNPWGYHLCSNLLHAANVALLFVLLRRLVALSQDDPTRQIPPGLQMALAGATLLFAVHPIAVEAVAGVSYSSDLLVGFFSLLALLAATVFRPDNARLALVAGTAGVLCAFASVTCKESGLSTALLLIVYWILFRRRESPRPWLFFLVATLFVSGAFLAARFLLAPPAPLPMTWLGGSFFQVFLIQPRLWIFMMGQWLDPIRLSADYTFENADGISTPVALILLVVMVGMQSWLAVRNRIGAMGMALYWLPLVAVSNFVPLFRPIADRFYYLPTAGVAMQLLALFLMIREKRLGLLIALGCTAVAILFLARLTLQRQQVFANEFNLWSDTLQVSPFSPSARNGYGVALEERGELDAAMEQFEKILEIYPNNAPAHNSLGNALVKAGQLSPAILHFREALQIDPAYEAAWYDLGIAFFKQGNLDAARADFEKTLAINPNHAKARNDLGVILFQQNHYEEAMDQFRHAVEIDPGYADAHNNYGSALLQAGQIGGAIGQFQQAVRLGPNNAKARDNLAKAQALAQ